MVNYRVTIHKKEERNNNLYHIDTVSEEFISVTGQWNRMNTVCGYIAIECNKTYREIEDLVTSYCYMLELVEDRFTNLRLEENNITSKYLYSVLIEVVE